MWPKKKKVEEPSALQPTEWELPDASAIQALARGEASPDQQQRALNWIIHNACGTYDPDYRVDPRDHAFASGKRFVGLQIVKVIKLNLMVFHKDTN